VGRGRGKGRVSVEDVLLFFALFFFLSLKTFGRPSTKTRCRPRARQPADHGRHLLCVCACTGAWRRPPFSHKLGRLAPFMPDVHPDAVLILEDDAKLRPG